MPLLPVVAAAALLAGGAGQKLKDLPPVADAQVVAAQPSSNYGSSTNLFVASASGGAFGDERAWLRFDLLGEIPPGATLHAAKLRLYNFRNDAQDLRVEVRSAPDGWSESGITWANQPVPGPVLATASLRADREFLWYELDVTPFVQAELAGDGLVSLVVRASREGDATWKAYGFDAREFGTNLAPRLRLEFSGQWSAAGGVKIIHFNDVHSRLTPHTLELPEPGGVTEAVEQAPPAPAGTPLGGGYAGKDPARPAQGPVFEAVGGGAYLAAKVLELKAANPDALVLDGGDVSEGNPLGDLRGNGGTIDFFDALDLELKALGGRGIDAVVVGNHDVRDLAMVNNMLASSVPFVSVNLLPEGTPTPYTTASPTFFPPYVVVDAGTVRVGVLGYSTDDSTYLGPDTEPVMDVADAVWSDADPSTIDLKDWVDHLRSVEGADVVVLLSHVGHRRLNSTDDALLGDTGDVRPPEVVIGGHWHTWTPTAWQPSNLNYGTTIVEAASYAQYVGELTLSAAGRYVDAVKHPVRVADIVPNPTIAALVTALRAEYDAGAPAWGLDQVIGHAAEDLRLDKDRWWTLSEFPWSGDNTAGEWVSDSMVWKALSVGAHVDLAIQSGGGIRRDVPAGPVTYLEIYETYPWKDDEMVRVQMSGQEIQDYVEGHYVGSSISAGWQVTAEDGIVTGITVGGAPLDLLATYDVAISEFMYLNDDWISESSSSFSFQALDPTPEYLGIRIRDAVVDYTSLFDASAPLTIPGPRYLLDTELAGGFRAVVTMTADAESQPYFEGVFVRLLEALPETLARRDAYGLAELVLPDGSIDPAAQFSETLLYRSHLGFPDGYLRPGDVLEVWGEGGFFAGNPQLVDQEGIRESERELEIVGHDASLAAPADHALIATFWDEEHENHLVRFPATRVGDARVRDAAGQEISVYQPGGFFTADPLPGANGDLLELTGVQTMRHPERRFRLRGARLAQPPWLSFAPVEGGVASPAGHVGVPRGSVALSPTDDAQVVEGNPSGTNGAFNSLYVQSAAPGASSFQNERAWLRFDLSAVPAGATIRAARLELYQWRTGQPAAMPAAVHGSDADGWSEATLTWSNQPAFGVALDVETLQAGVTGAYVWDVRGFVAAQQAGDGVASFVVKPVTEGASPALTYSFDSKEWSDPSQRPVLVVDYGQ